MSAETYSLVWQYSHGEKNEKVNEFVDINKKFLFDQGASTRPKFMLERSCTNREEIMKIVKGKKKIVVDKDRALKLITEIYCPEAQQACKSIGVRRIDRTFSDVNGIRYLVEDVLKKCNGICKKMKSVGVPPPPMPVK